jgi:hypothetical protein
MAANVSNAGFSSTWIRKHWTLGADLCGVASFQQAGLTATDN